MDDGNSTNIEGLSGNWKESRDINDKKEGILIERSLSEEITWKYLKKNRVKPREDGRIVAEVEMPDQYSYFLLFAFANVIS